MNKEVVRSRALPVWMCVYGAASLLHFAHNAIFLRDYPNMPAWLTAGGVMGAWSVVAAVGVVGYAIYRYAHHVGGLILISVYAVLGFGGLDHYVVAPLAAHTLAMNLTIAMEGLTAVLLLVEIGRLLVLRLRTN